MRRDQKAQKKCEEKVRGLEIEMEQRADAHHLCEEYYGKLKAFLFILLLVAGGALAGCKALFNDWNMLWSWQFAIFIFVLASAVSIIKRLYSWATDSHETHYKERKNCQNIAERARALHDASDLTNSRKRVGLDELYKDMRNFRRTPDKWAKDRVCRENKTETADE